MASSSYSAHVHPRRNSAKPAMGRVANDNVGDLQAYMTTQPKLMQVQAALAQISCQYPPPQAQGNSFIMPQANMFPGQHVINNAMSRIPLHRTQKRGGEIITYPRTQTRSGLSASTSDCLPFTSHVFERLAGVDCTACSRSASLPSCVLAGAGGHLPPEEVRMVRARDDADVGARA